MAKDKRRATPFLRVPGEKSAVAYLWLIYLAPILLLVASIVLTVVGLWRDSEGVATIGAIGIVASLILPKMKGLFKLGPGGVEGESRDDLFEEVMRQAMARGLERGEAAQVAQAARDEVESPRYAMTVSVGEGEIQGWWPMNTRGHDYWRSIYAASVVEDAIRHENSVVEVARRVAEEQGWRVVEEPPVFGNYGRVDVAIETDEGLVLVEANNLTGLGGSGFALIWMALGRTKQELAARAAFVVLPDVSELGSTEVDGVVILKLHELEEALLDL